MLNPSSSSSLEDYVKASHILSLLRTSGFSRARSQAQFDYSNGSNGLLVSELYFRLLGFPSPRIIIDGLWFHFQYGGVARVWTQILDTLSLPGIVSRLSPIAIIDRFPGITYSSAFTILKGRSLDPLDLLSVQHISIENSFLVRDWSADVFCSSWISTSGFLEPSCSELIVLHDCIPERFTPKDPKLLSVRSRWINGASSVLSVSADSSYDLHRYYNFPLLDIAWCHPSPISCQSSNKLLFNWSSFLSITGISSNFVLLAGSACVGSYKNPEIVCQALLHPSLHGVDLLLTGANSTVVRTSLLSLFPALEGRIVCACFTDYELSIAYKQAISVIVPSLIEGFGLPVLEVLRAGGIPLVSNTRGLRESSGESCFRFNPYCPHELVLLLQILLDTESRSWYQSIVHNRVCSRLSRLSPDLFALHLLVQARYTR